MASDNNIEIGIYLSALIGMVELGRIPSYVLPRVEATVSELFARIDQTGDVSAEQLLEYIEAKVRHY